jgi:hypothetical protein
LESPPSTLLRDFVQVFIPEKFYIPRERDFPTKSLRGLEVEVTEFTINDVCEFLKIIHPRIFPVIFISSSLIIIKFCIIIL